MESIALLEKELKKAKRVESKSFAKWRAGKATWAEHQETSDAVTDLERRLAKAQGLPFAETLEFPVQWNPGAPIPFLFVTDNKTFLTFYVHTPDPDWDGTYCRVVDPASGEIEKLALVEFMHCHSAKLGDPSDEAFNGHNLWNAGFESYKAQVVRNSSWLAELRKINARHSCFDPDLWQKLKHYILWFHDTVFECVAEGYEVEVFDESMASMLKRVSERLLK